jgi:hypothetical protein
MIDTAQHIPVSKPNQQIHSTGVMYVDYQLSGTMTLDELNKAIIYLVQIQQYAKHNNIPIIGFNK